jgi:hypothetical protein
MGGVLGTDFDLVLFALLLALAAAGATSGATAAGATAAGTGSRSFVLPFILYLFAFLASAALRAFSFLDNGGGAWFSGSGAGFSFGAEFAFKSRAAFRVCLTFSAFAFKNLPLTMVPSASLNFLILPLPDDGGGGPPGGGAMPAGVSGLGGGIMCNTNSFGFLTPFPFPLPVPPYGVV